MKFCIFVLSAYFLVGCSSKVLHVDNSEKILKIDDYDKKLKIIEIAPPPESTIATAKPISKAQKKKTRAERRKEKREKAELEAKMKLIKQPAIEDKEGFAGRRPIVDPFHVGEKVTLKLSYFNITAGYMTVEVLPFVEVNGRKSYHLEVTGQSNSLFSNFYAVDDSAETYMDYEDMVPYNMAVHVKESKQLREVRSYFDWKKLTAKFWEKKITKKDGIEEKNLEWKIEPYSQNVFSAAFYLRTFKLVPGKTIEFRVSDNEKNMIVKGHVLRREKLETAIGTLDTLVIRPEIQIGGIFQPVGEVLFWVTDDDRKFIVRIESKIKIGTIVASVTEIQRN